MNNIYEGAKCHTNFLLEYYIEGSTVHKAEYTGSLRSVLRYALNSISSKNAITNVVDIYKVEDIWIKVRSVSGLKNF